MSAFEGSQATNQIHFVDENLDHLNIQYIACNALDSNNDNCFWAIGQNVILTFGTRLEMNMASRTMIICDVKVIVRKYTDQKRRTLDSSQTSLRQSCHVAYQKVLV